MTDTRLRPTLRVSLFPGLPSLRASYLCSVQSGSGKDRLTCSLPGTFRVQLRLSSDAAAYTLVCDRHFEEVVLWPTFLSSPDVDDSENTDD